jgi:hypothetical protein
MNTALRSSISSFNPIGLDKLRSSLATRIDTKFIFHQDLLPEILNHLSTEYQMLEVDGYRLSPYRTLYYDTADLQMYYDHHRARVRRYKVRVREYQSSGLSFLEVKAKQNRSLTVKTRIERPDLISSFNDKEEEFILLKTGQQMDLKPAIKSFYERITLVHPGMQERLTFDVNLSFSSDTQDIAFPGLVIAELKRGRAHYSKFQQVSHDFNIHPQALSKYCLGISSLREVKHNRFKFKHLLIEKVLHNAHS